MIEPIEELFRKEVLSFTNGTLKLNNSSRPILYKTQKEYLDVYKKITNFKIPTGSSYIHIPRGFMGNDFLIHLNPSDPEWHIPIMSFYQLPAFFTEKSELGQDLSKTGEYIDIFNDDRYFFLDGIGRWVEIKNIDEIKYGHRELIDLEKELIEDVKFRPCYEAFQMCDHFWDAAQKQKSDLSNLLGTKKPEPGEIIIASVLAASRLAMTEKDLYKDFNRAFSKLGDIAFHTEGKSIVDIYLIGRMYRKKENIVIPTEDVKYLENVAKELGFLIATNKQVSEIEIVLKKTTEKLSEINRQYGQNPFTEFAKSSLDLYNIVKKAADNGPGKTLSQTESDIPVLKDLLPNFLIKYSSQLNEYRKKINGS